MLLRLKGKIEFSSKTSCDAFESEIIVLKTTKTVNLDNSSKDGNVFNFDIALADSKETKRIFDDIQTRSKLNINKVYIHIHKCRLESGDEGLRGNISEFSSYTYNG